MTSNVWHRFLYLSHERTRKKVLITFQHYHVTQHLIGRYICWKQDQKYKTKTKTEVGRPWSQTPRLVVIKILQGSVVTQTVLGGLTLYAAVANFL